MDVAIAILALLIQRTQPLVQPRRALGKVSRDKRMHDLMHERAAAGLDVHHQGFVPRGVVAKGCMRALLENVDRVLLVTGLVLEQPDIDDVIRVLTEVVSLEPLNSPADCALGMSPNGTG